ncbi:serine hydrolase domain-containing protein [Streptomyces sp. NPDC051546]|uniref:serine hydrolase domain-containing protein n=1 Tax=Streptomyces sp. NPDC051546 TaxID=3365655 RepID=UPI0037B70320
MGASREGSGGPGGSEGGRVVVGEGWVGCAEPRVDRLLSGLVAGGQSPGAVAVLGTLGGSRMVVSAGVVAPECGDAAPTRHTRYDAASLTKVMVVWPLVGIALDAGLLDLDRPVGTYAGELPQGLPGAAVTVRQILTHTAGLMARTRIDSYGSSRLPLAELICAEPLESVPGTVHRYVDRGFILLGLILPRLLGMPLERLAQELVWEPAGLTRTTYSPVGRGPDVAPTMGHFPDGPRMWGQVHDDNAAFLGGAAGNAGVFTTAADLAAYAVHLLTTHDAPTSWLRRSIQGHVKARPGAARGLAWLVSDTGVVHHHGFTGTSLFVVPDTGRYLALCTNAIYHGRERRALPGLRADLIKLIAEQTAPPREAADARDV